MRESRKINEIESRRKRVVEIKLFMDFHFGFSNVYMITRRDSFYQVVSESARSPPLNIKTGHQGSFSGYNST